MVLLSRALCRFSAITRYMFLKACKDRTVSSVPRYSELVLEQLSQWQSRHHDQT